MKTLRSLGLKCEGGRILVLDQQKLPDEELWIDCRTPLEMVALIKSLKIRGAPLIGVAAAVSLARFAAEGASGATFSAAAAALRAARPTAVNLMAAVDRLLEVAALGGGAAALVAEAETIFDEDVALCEGIAAHGARLIQDGDGVLTHCNSGGLATAGIGTALGVIRKAHEQGKKIHVYVDETRPLLQGGRLTAWELGALGIPYTLICDNMSAIAMREGKVQRIFVGADRIAVNGDFANKVGTYGVAVLAQHHRIPFYTAAPYTTVDFKCLSGVGIPIEEREPEEVRGAAGAFGAVRWAPKGSRVFNPAFDVTPRELLAGIVLDSGVLSRKELEAGALGELGARRESEKGRKS